MGMRFETRFDHRLMVCLALAALVTCVLLPAIRFLAPGSHPAPRGLVFAPLVIWAALLRWALPQYYVLQKTGLFLRQGWKKTFIPYASLFELQSLSDSRGAGVFSPLFSSGQCSW